MLTKEQILKILELIRKAEGRTGGYSEDPEIGGIEAALSIMLQATAR